MNLRDIDKIGEWIKNQDFSDLLQLCDEYELNDSSDNTEKIYENLMTQIENDSQLMEYFKEVAKKDKTYKTLIHYCCSKENTKYFIEHYEEYGLDYNDMKLMREFHNKSFMKDRKTNFESKEENKIISTFAYIVCFFIIVLLLRPYILTHITNQANITNAVVISSDIGIDWVRDDDSTGHGYHWDKIPYNVYGYEYYANGKKYFDSSRRTAFSKKMAEKRKNVEEIQVYYDKDNPQKSGIYYISKPGVILFIVWILSLVLDVFIKIKKNKQKIN